MRSLGRLRIAWHYKAGARGAGATLLPGEALIRRLKLVAAPARSESEPDPGGHASHATYSDLVTKRPIAVPLRDGHRRVVRDLRISITDRCNLRCSYCMP